MARRNDWLEKLLWEYAAAEDRRLSAAEQTWRRRVPPELDETVRRLQSGDLPPKPLLGRPCPARSLPHAAPARAAGGLTAGRVTLLSAAAAALLAGGAYTLSPPLRAAVNALFCPPAQQQEEHVQQRTPREYVLPSPGEEFTVTDEAVGETMQGRWYTSEEMEVLVQVAYRLPEDTSHTENVELVTVGRLWGTYHEAGGTRLLILRDGEVFIHIEFWGAEKETLFAYAELLAAANE